MDGTPAAKGDAKDSVAVGETLSSEEVNDTLASTAEPAAQTISSQAADEEKKNEINDHVDEHVNRKEPESFSESIAVTEKDSPTAVETEDTQSETADPVEGEDSQKKGAVPSTGEGESLGFLSDRAAGEAPVNKEKELDTLDEKMAAYFSGDEKLESDSTASVEHLASEESFLSESAAPPLPDPNPPSPELLQSSTECHNNTKVPPAKVETPTMEIKASSDAEDDDVSSKAAIALAAVAAAATANHKSPAEAAAQARMVAQTLLSTNESNATPEGGTEKPRKFQSVRLTLVKTHLRQRALEAGSQLMDKLAMGQNDAFLQHLLLLEYLRAVGDDESPPDDEPVDDPAVANLACDRVWSLLKKIEGAYESLLQLLPDGRNKKDEGEVPADYESPVVVPDLLPPCTSQKGDATVGFFRACTLYNENKDAKSDSSDQSPAQKTHLRRPSESSSVATASTSAETQGDAASSASSRSMFSGMFRRQTSQQNVSKIPPSSMTASGILNTFRKKKKG